ncbi:UDP-glucose flavonoid 3-O-glucosyltransferase 7-like [Triticum dicoccoides]|uniref:UDP-glucose flavonoid 3-O-glucosyltransferase 7-like n=1 Tax=Triticum dicoccoides TaxID=85692 RepID=UPI00188E18AA|nr:UDP-glucose flavonoid 3-O-glucosyltransferase 7-like [Triticum dicoccoides]
MASSTTSSGSKTLRVLLLPHFATGHIHPFTELAVSLAASSPPNAAVEAIIAVTPANVPIVQSLLERHSAAAVKIVTYPFPTVEGLPKGVENLGKAATQADSMRINIAASSEPLMRPAHETLVRAHSPDAIFTDMLFTWSVDIADKLDMPCVAFHVTGAFTMLAMRHLMMEDTAINGEDMVTAPPFPTPQIRIPRTELPDLSIFRYVFGKVHSMQAACFGLAVNTFSGLEQQYCDMYMCQGYVQRSYFVGPQLQSSHSPTDAAADSKSQYIRWLDTKSDHSVAYVSFGSCALVSEAQLDQLALGLEASGKSFLWVVRAAEKWTPPKGWEKRVEDRGLIITSWAPQTSILAHPAVGVFLTHCGWNSVLEAVAAGVPMLTWPKVHDQFVNERLIADVLGIGDRLWPHGAGLRREDYEKHEVIPADDVARALLTFMHPGGPGDVMRTRVMDLASKSHAAIAGGSSHQDLHRLVNDLMAAKGGRS